MYFDEVNLETFVIPVRDCIHRDDLLQWKISETEKYPNIHPPSLNSGKMVVLTAITLPCPINLEISGSDSKL